MSPCTATTARIPRLKPLTSCVLLALAASTCVALAHADGDIAHAPRGGIVLPVSSCLDDGSPGTLRSVIAGAGEGDTIDLTQLTCSTITLVDGPIDITILGSHLIYDLNIQGPGQHALTIDGANRSPLFNHGGYSSDGTIAFSDLTIANGRYTEGGAGCINSFASVRLTRTTVTNCHSRSALPVNFGGAVSATANLEMISSTISDSSNTSTTKSAIGGGAYAGYGATLVDSTISGNRVVVETPGSGSARTGGGGIYTKGTLSLTNSTISNNRADAGTYGRGGGLLGRSDASLIDSTLEGNTASGDGGALFKANYTNYGDSFSTLSVVNTTISGNAAQNGGGIASLRPTTLHNSTLAFNTALGEGGGFAFVDNASGLVTLEIQSTLLAANSADASGASAADLYAGTGLPIGGSNNLIVAAGSLSLPVDTLAGDPQLLPLADNGGATRTHALSETSPAIDTGNNAAALDFDQRGSGFPRVVGVAADIGAFEHPSPGDPDRIFRDGFD